MPRPRISMWWRMRSGARPIGVPLGPGAISTTSSATSRCPRATSSSAHSLLPIPLGPSSSTPTPCTSSKAPCSRVAGAAAARAPARGRAAGLELLVFFLDRTDHVRGGLGCAEPLAEGRVAEEARDARQRLEVAPARVLGHDEQEEVVRRLAVDRVEVDALVAAGEARDQPVEADELPVGNRDALADPRALEPLALEQHLEQAVRLDAGLD